jgi:endonuclease-3 related protein
MRKNGAHRASERLAGVPRLTAPPRLPVSKAQRRREARDEAAGARLAQFFSALYRAWGPQHWWPADTPFEVMVGAILTQNTNWTNVEKAIARLKDAKLLSPDALYYAPTSRVAELIRPAGYYNVKARRLHSFLSFLYRQAGGSEKRLRALPTGELRARLLQVNGLGPETADSILLYALGRPVFVVDAYTRRILRRHLLIRGDEPYQAVRSLFERHLPRNRTQYGEYHALLVRAGKQHCRVQARCEGCPLAPFPHRAKR